MKASKTSHQGATYIRLDFTYEETIVERIRQITGARWSSVLKAWLLPYNKETFNRLKQLFPDIEYPNKKCSIPAPEIPPLPTPHSTAKHLQKPGEVSIEVCGRNIFVKMKKIPADVEFIRSLRYSRWDKNAFLWAVSNYPGNLERIKNHFEGRIVSLQVHENFEQTVKADKRITVGNKEIVLIKTASGRVKLIFGYSLPLVRTIKKIPYFKWDKTNKWWTIPFSERFVGLIKETAKQEGYSVREDVEDEATNKVPRRTPFDVPNYRPCPDEYLLKMKELRYSENSIKNYKSHFEEFINYYNQKDINSLGDRDIVIFERYLVMDRKVSSSYQNLSINAINPVGFLNQWICTTMFTC